MGDSTGFFLRFVFIMFWGFLFNFFGGLKFFLKDFEGQQGGGEHWAGGGILITSLIELGGREL